MVTLIDSYNGDGRCNRCSLHKYVFEIEKITDGAYVSHGEQSQL